VENPVSWLEILSIVSSLVSLVIGGLAIWLAVRFYEMSTKSSEKLEQASNNIDSTTKRLETLFDKLYADTFAMVKDTVSDMRKHVWKADDNEKDISEDKLSQLKSELSAELAENFKNGDQRQEISALKEKLSELLDKAVEKSASISKESIEGEVLECIKELGEYGRKVTMGDIISYLDFDEKRIVHAIFTLKEQGKITWGEGRKSKGLRSDDNIQITRLGNS